MVLKATHVFTPGSFPTHTYVAREGINLEQDLVDSIETKGQIVSLIGPSKSGKTVLVEKSVGPTHLITVTGASIHSPDDIWSHVLDFLNAPSAQIETKTNSQKVAGEIGAGVEVAIPLVAKASAKTKASTEGTEAFSQASTFSRGGLRQVADQIADTPYVLLVDDFHYMEREVQAAAAKSLKEAVRLGIKVCTASVVHRGDDLVRALPELRGRVRALDLAYWPAKDLEKIVVAGLALLNAQFDSVAIDSMVTEAAGSPQLMQLICLHACLVLNIRQRLDKKSQITVTNDQLTRIFEQASTVTDFRSLVDVLDAGPKTRGTERKIYNFVDGSCGDVYRAVLKALSSNPPSLSLSYDDLLKRTARTCVDETPVGSSVTGTCLHISRLALEKFPSERTIDWDETKQIFDIPDPYFLFYLRWSGRLSEPEA